MTVTPSDHITGIDVVAGASTVTGTDTDKFLLIPLTSIPQLTEAEVTDSEDGDIRKVAFALAEMVYQVYAAEPVASRPTNWSSYRSPGTEDDDGYATRSYSNTFEVSVGSVEVKDEPA